MPQIISMVKDDLKVDLLLSCFVGHPVRRMYILKKVKKCNHLQILENIDC